MRHGQTKQCTNELNLEAIRLTHELDQSLFQVFRSLGITSDVLSQAAKILKRVWGYDRFRGKDPVPPGWNEWDVAGGGGYKEFHYSLNENGKAKHYGRAAGDYMADVLAGKAEAVAGTVPTTLPGMLTALATCKDAAACLAVGRF